LAPPSGSASLDSSGDQEGEDGCRQCRAPGGAAQGKAVSRLIIFAACANEFTAIAAAVPRSHISHLNAAAQRKMRCTMFSLIATILQFRAQRPAGR
jgi:hypothetical protein